MKGRMEYQPQKFAPNQGFTEERLGHKERWFQNPLLGKLVKKQQEGP